MRMRGSTLVEAMVSFAVLAIGMVAFAQAIVVSAQSDRVARARTLSSALAHEMEACLKQQLFGSSMLTNTSTTNDSYSDHGDPITGRDSNREDIFSQPPDHSDTADAAELLAKCPGTFKAADLNALQGSDGAAFYNYRFRRYWNVAPVTEEVGDGGVGAVRQAHKGVNVIVSFDNGAGGRASSSHHFIVSDETLLMVSVGGTPAL